MEIRDKILIVEDEKSITSFISAILQANGYDTIIAHTGAEAFNLGTGDGVSVLELVHAFRKVNGVEVPYVIGDRRDGDLAEVYANPTRANDALHWRAEKSVDDMCRDAWHFIQTRVAEG